MFSFRNQIFLLDFTGLKLYKILDNKVNMIGSTRLLLLHNQVYTVKQKLGSPVISHPVLITFFLSNSITQCNKVKIHLYLNLLQLRKFV